MDIKIMITSFVSYVLGCLVNEFVIHGKRKPKRVTFQYRLDHNFVFPLPTLLIVRNAPAYLKGNKMSIEFYFLVFHFRWQIREKGEE